MYLGTIYLSTKFRPDWSYGRQVAILEKKQSAITLELMSNGFIGISNKYI
jgi:hypothetical protein